MKKICVLLALSAVSTLSADRFMDWGYHRGYGWDGGPGYWQSGFESGPGCCCQDGGWVMEGGQGWQNEEPRQWSGGPGGQWNGGPGGQWNGGPGGMVMPGFQRVGDRFQLSDPEIAKKIHDALSSDKAYHDLFFRVDGGIVTIRGPVETPEQRSKVEEAIKKIDSVRHINNQLMTRPKPVADHVASREDHQTTSTCE